MFEVTAATMAGMWLLMGCAHPQSPAPVPALHPIEKPSLPSHTQAAQKIRGKFHELRWDISGVTADHGHGDVFIEGDYITISTRSRPSIAPKWKAPRREVAQISFEIWAIDSVNRRALKVARHVERAAVAVCFDSIEDLTSR